MSQQRRWRPGHGAEVTGSDAVNLDDDVALLKHCLPRRGPLEYHVHDDEPAFVGSRWDLADDKSYSRGAACVRGWLFCQANFSLGFRSVCWAGIKNAIRCVMSRRQRLNTHSLSAARTLRTSAILANVLESQHSAIACSNRIPSVSDPLLAQNCDKGQRPLHTADWPDTGKTQIPMYSFHLLG